MRRKLARVVPNAGTVGVLALLACASGCASLQTASREGDLARVQKLLASGANPNEGSDGEYPLCDAVRFKQDAVVDALLRAGAKPTIDCKLGYKTYWPIHLAGNVRHAEIAKRLLDAGATPPDSTYFLKLIIAKVGGDVAPRPKCTRNARAVAKVLLDHVERTAGHEKLVAYVMTRSSDNDFIWSGWSPMSAAVNCGDNEMVDEILAHFVDANVYVDAAPLAGPGSGNWPLIYFARLGDGGNVTTRILINAGANPNVTTREGKTFAQAAKAAAAFAAHQQRKREQYLADLHEEWRESEREEKQRREAASRAAFESLQRGLSDTTWNTHTPPPTVANTRGAAPPATAVANPEPTREASPSTPSMPWSAVPSSGTARDCHDEPNERPIRTVAFPSRAEAESSLDKFARSACSGDYTLRDNECPERHQPVWVADNGKLVQQPDKILYQCSATAVCARPKRVCAGGSPEQSGAVRQ